MSFKNKTVLICIRTAFIFLCGRRDSNPHAVKRQILSLVRLPITPLPQLGLIKDCKDSFLPQLSKRKMKYFQDFIQICAKGLITKWINIFGGKGLKLKVER
jgi:hypothetical protein